MEHPGLPVIGEDEHQALDLIEDSWTEAPAANTASEPEASSAHIPLARQLVDRTLLPLSRSLREALGQFAPQPAPAHQLDAASLQRALADIESEPRLCLGLTTLRELVAEAIGAAPGGGVDSWLRTLASEREVSAQLFALDRALISWVKSAYPSAATSGKARRGALPITPAARVLRCTLVRDFHPQVRAAALAAEQPERMDQAVELILAHPEDIPAQIDALAQVRAEQEATALAAGPPRRFTKWHLLFALIIAGLTAYQYWWR